MKIILPEVKASGRREGSWFHVKGLAAGRHGGLRRFEGERLAPGECDLPIMAVVLALRPTGPARSAYKAADVYHVVEDAHGNLGGVAFGLSWMEGDAFKPLQEAVQFALNSKRRYDEVNAALREALLPFRGKPVWPETLLQLKSIIGGVISQSIPRVTGLDVVGDEGGDGIDVKFSVKGVDL